MVLQDRDFSSPANEITGCTCVGDECLFAAQTRSRCGLCIHRLMAEAGHDVPERLLMAQPAEAPTAPLARSRLRARRERADRTLARRTPCERPRPCAVVRVQHNSSPRGSMTATAPSPQLTYRRPRFASTKTSSASPQVGSRVALPVRMSKAASVGGAR
jgi:hypothetical protein